MYIFNVCRWKTTKLLFYDYMSTELFYKCIYPTAKQPIIYKCFQSTSTEDKGGQLLEDRYKDVMKNVSQPVAVVTSAIYDKKKALWFKRGVTCSSFTSISLIPPIVSFAVRNNSRMHELLLQTKKFAVHLLADNQTGYAMHFSKPAVDTHCQFTNIPHEQDEEGIPVLRDTMAVVFCTPHSVHLIGDHHVWYGNVVHAYSNSQVSQPLLYFKRKFRSIGDETFMTAFEDQTLPFVDWTHEAHLRMAWNYIREFGKDQATPLIKDGIKRYNEQNIDKIGRGYHETVTSFFIHMISHALFTNGQDATFEEFIHRNKHFLDKHLLFNYYSDEVINSKEAKVIFLLPDKQQLPDTGT